MISFISSNILNISNLKQQQQQPLNVDVFDCCWLSQEYLILYRNNKEMKLRGL